MQCNLSPYPQPTSKSVPPGGPNTTRLQTRASETHLFRWRFIVHAQASRLSCPPPPGQDRALTRRESGYPCNLVGDVSSEYREVLLVAFEVRRHGGSGVARLGRSLGRGWGHRGQKNRVQGTQEGSTSERSGEPGTAPSPAASWLFVTILVLRKLGWMRFLFSAPATRLRNFLTKST